MLNGTLCPFKKLLNFIAIDFKCKSLVFWMVTLHWKISRTSCR